MSRIEDPFEPLPEPEDPKVPTAPTPLDEAVLVHGFDNVYRALLDMAAKEEDR